MAPDTLSAKNLPGGMLNRQRYWHALPRGWQDMDYQAFLTERRKLMAQVTRDAYAKLSDHGYTPVYPEAGHLRDDDQQGGRAHYGVNLADLIEAELLPAGTTLLPAQRDLDAIATVLPDGKIAYADEIYNTLPPARATLRPADQLTAGRSGSLIPRTGGSLSRPSGSSW